MNTYPAEIEAALEAHPDICEAAAFGIQSDDWGELVHAVVVKRDGSDLDEDGVKEFAREHLARPAAPPTSDCAHGVRHHSQRIVLRCRTWLKSGSGR